MIYSSGFADIRNARPAYPFIVNVVIRRLFFLMNVAGRIIVRGKCMMHKYGKAQPRTDSAFFPVFDTPLFSFGTLN